MRWLIIEDDLDANAILAAYCRELGHQPIQSYYGEEGLRAAQLHHPDVVLLDLMLPDTNGYAICEKLKLDRKTNPIPIVMVTALWQDEDRMHGYRVGADAYITKPYRLEQISEAVEVVLEHKREREQQGIESFLQIDLSSELANLQSLNDFFSDALAHTPLSEKECNQLRIALREMGQNAIEWGNKQDASKTVTITSAIRADHIEIIITDEGEGFDPQHVPHAASDEDDTIAHFEIREALGLREGGFGMMIVRGLVDEVKYNDRGNQVTLLKRFRRE